MWKVVICDADQDFADRLGRCVKRFYRERNFEVQVQVCVTGNALLQKMGEQTDLLFLNTRMPGMRGYALAKQLQREGNRQMALVFLSDHDEDVFEAFAYQPVGYLRKQLAAQELETILCRLWGRVHARRSIKVRCQRTDMLIRMQDMVYLVSEGHYISAHCVDGKIYRFRGRMAVYEQLLQGNFFVHTTKSYLVNCAYITEIGERVGLKNGVYLPCSKARKAEVRKLHDCYLLDTARIG